MSQIIACKNQNGVVLAADSEAIDFTPGGEMTELKVNRLIQLNQNSAILTGGSAGGEKMCLALKEFLSGEDLNDVEEVYGAALPFLASEYERFMRKYCEILPLDPVHQVHFILGGTSPKESETPFRLYLIWNKKKLPQLDGDEIDTAFTVPRIMRLEYKLSNLCKTNAPLDQVLSEIRASLEKQAEVQEEVGEPFSYAFITKDGFREV
jgi:hypothetical protein